MRQLKLFKKSRRGRPKIKNGAVPHLQRELFRGRLPVHVTLRVFEDVENLQHGRCFKALRGAFLAASDKFGVRLVHFAVLGNHLHLICEADGKEALSKGMQGLEIRMAKGLNRVLKRSGHVFTDRYHVRVLRSPPQVRNAVNYVLRNHERHGRPGEEGITSVWFPELTLPPRTWPLKVALRV